MLIEYYFDKSLLDIIEIIDCWKLKNYRHQRFVARKGRTKFNMKYITNSGRFFSNTIPFSGNFNS